jgi:hypothetical protein
MPKGSLRAQKRAQDPMVQARAAACHITFKLFLQKFESWNKPFSLIEETDCEKDCDGPTHCNLNHGPFCPLILTDTNDYDKFKHLWCYISSLDSTDFPPSIKTVDDRKDFVWNLHLGNTKEMYEKYYPEAAKAELAKQALEKADL